MATAALERPESAPAAAFERVVEAILGRPPDERVADALEPSGGHLVTYAGSAAPDVVAPLERSTGTPTSRARPCTRASTTCAISSTASTT